MRVLVATDQWDPDAVGGSARVATATAYGFAAAGHSVTAVSPHVDGLPAVETSNGVELHRALRRTPLPQTFGDPLDTWRWGRGRQSPDVIVAHQATVATGASRAFAGVPLLYVFHASAPLEQRFARRRAAPPRRAAMSLLDPVLTGLERHAVASAGRIAVLSEFSRRLVVERHPAATNRIALVRGGVDLARFATADGTATRDALGLPDGVPLLLSVRRLEPRMGLEELLRAVALLRDRGRRTLLAIAGSGVVEGDLRRLATELGLDDDVRFLGRVPDDVLPGLYAAADLFVLPTVAYEGFGMATVEALAAGTPVVGTPVGATPELLAPLDPGLIAASAAPDALAAAIEAALAASSAELRARCATYAASTFAWEHAIEPWLTALAATAAGA